MTNSILQRIAVTDGELQEMFEGLAQTADTETEWRLVSALGELIRVREGALDEMLKRASCDDDFDTCFIGVTG